MRTMETSANKETFKLLKISDDSKSFSDLDLPEITNQRKRKVRRKTRPRLVSSTNIPHPDVSTTSTKQCSALAIWIIVFLSCCWLLTLSYMIAVIHSENLRLEVQIKKLTVTSQNLPEALQQWHETSKQLEQNQTILYSKIADLQRFFGNLNDNLTQLKAKVDDIKNFSKDDKFVAEFGAKIAAVTDDVERIKERIAEFQKDQSKISENVQQLQNNFTSLTVTAANHSSNIDYSNEIQNLQKSLGDKFNDVKYNLTLVNDTFSQKTNNLNEDITTQREKIDELFERSANITSHVTSIENDWNKDKAIDFNSTKIKFAKDISDLKNASIYLKKSMDEVRSTWIKFQANMLQNLNRPESPVGDIIPTDKQQTLLQDFMNNNKSYTEDTSNNNTILPNMR